MAGEHERVPDVPEVGEAAVGVVAEECMWGTSMRVPFTGRPAIGPIRRGP